MRAVRGIRPTRKQKQIMVAKRLNPSNWLVVKNEVDKFHIIHRKENTLKIIAL